MMLIIKMLLINQALLGARNKQFADEFIHWHVHVMYGVFYTNLALTFDQRWEVSHVTAIA